jgi:hypothetical protein
LLHFRPYEDDANRKREIFTEGTLMMLLYVLNAFKGENNSPEVQYKWGWAGIAIVSVYLGYHLTKTGIGGINQV